MSEQNQSQENKFKQWSSLLWERLLAYSQKAYTYIKAGWYSLPLKWRIAIPLGVFIGIPTLTYLILSACIALGIFGKLPGNEALKNIKMPLAAEIYTSDSVLIGKYYIENRKEITYGELSPLLVNALIATEDARFYEHSGVDTRSMFRVLFKTILLQDRSSGGGSTISQQLAKNLFKRKRYWVLGTIINKMREARIARRLEKIYSKEEIITLYLNTIPFGEGTYGIGSAAYRFFNTTPYDLKPEESATLVGLLKATSYYNPRVHPERAHARRNVVLEQMQKHQVITLAEKDSLQALPLNLKYRQLTVSDGVAPYFRSFLMQELKEWLRAFPKEDGSYYNLFTDGLKIYTTIDSRLQQHAEKALEQHMKTVQKNFFDHWAEKGRPWGEDSTVVERALKRSDRYRQLSASGRSKEEIAEILAKPISMRVFSWDGPIDTMMSPLDSIVYSLYFLNAGFLAMDQYTGNILAWVGGIDHKYFKYDHVKAPRQVGSVFKPIVYATALEAGVDPCAYVSNEQIVYEAYEGWTPGNSNEEYDGLYSMEGGLMKSVNTVAVKTIMNENVGPRKVVSLARKMGVSGDLPSKPSLALGSADLSLFELIKIYATFANGGYACEPRYLERIEDNEGKVLLKAPKVNVRSNAPIISKNVSRIINRMLQQVVNAGTASRIRSTYALTGAIAGKTGTSQSQADGWFMGYTPTLVGGTWVGAAEPTIRFRSMSLGQGSSTALPIFALFMRNVYNDYSLQKYHKGSIPGPDSLISLTLDCPPFLADSLELQQYINPPADTASTRLMDSIEARFQRLIELERRLDDFKQRRLERFQNQFESILQLNEELKRGDVDKLERINRKLEQLEKQLPDTLKKGGG